MKKTFNYIKFIFLLSFLLITISSFYINKLSSNNNKYTLSKIDLNPNEVPYLSTYYIKPIVAPNEDVILDFYITDYSHKEYLKNDTSESFTITIRIDGKKDIIKKHIKAGDNSINIGSFSKLGEQKFSILATDNYGRNSHELFNYFLVQDKVESNEYIMTNSDLTKYNIKNLDSYESKHIISMNIEDLTSDNVKKQLEKEAANITPSSNGYSCIIADTTGDSIPDNWWEETIVKYGPEYNSNFVLEESTNTRLGLQKLLNDKKDDGYTGIKLLPGTYRIDHTSPIYIPTEFTLNMNTSTIKLNQFTGDKAIMVELNNTVNSHVINGTIEGDYYTHDYTNSANKSEWVMGINIGGESKYSSFDNLIVKDITGYGGGNGIANSPNKTLGYTYLPYSIIGDSFTSGDIDRTSGLSISSENRVTSDFLDISGYSDIGYLSISRYLGYQGNPLNTWNMIIHFYDSNNSFIKSIDSYQYRRVRVPENASNIKVTLLTTECPTDLSIQYFRVPTHCSFKNIKFENCRAVGLAQAAMKDMLVENCEFTRCGQTLAKCAYDAEDGWDMMQDVTFRNLSFYNNPNNEFLTCAGHNFIVENMNCGSTYIWERTNSFVLKDSSNINVTIAGGEAENRSTHGIYRIYNNNFIDGSLHNNLGKNNSSIGSLSGIIHDSNIGGIATDSTYENCTINVSNSTLGYLSKIKMINCTFIPTTDFNERYSFQFNGGHLDDYYFENCSFYGKSNLINNNGFYSGSFIKCNFEDTNIKPNVEANSNDLILFDNCDINYSENSLIYYSPFAYTKGTNSQIEFNNCTITNIDNNMNSLVYAYSKPNGYLTFNNSTLNLPNNLILFDGAPINIEYIKNYKLLFKKCDFMNSYIPTSEYFNKITLEITE